MNAKVIDGRAGFVAVRLEGGGIAVVCAECGASLRLKLGRNDARLMAHEPECKLGAAIAQASTTKQVLMRPRVMGN